MEEFAVVDRPMPVSVAELDAATTVAEFTALLNRQQQSSGMALRPTASAVAAETKIKCQPGQVTQLLKASWRVPPPDARVKAMVRAYGASEAEVVAWTEAYTSVVSGSGRRRAAGAVRVDGADSVLLGVHRPIEVVGATAAQPVYVPRDYDANLDRKLDEAAVAGGLVLLVGESSTGKSRSAFEALKRRLRGWWVVYPAITGIRELLDGVTVPTVVWLEDLHRYLDVSDGLDDGLLRVWLRRSRPVVVLATVERRRFRHWAPIPSGAADDPDQFAKHRAVCELAAVIPVDPELTAREQERAEYLAQEDVRLSTALAVDDFGLIQTLAAGSALIEQWKIGGPYVQALVAAVVDARDLGIEGPVSAEFLRDAAPGYLSDSQRRLPIARWFADALEDVTRELLGATSMLPPVSGLRPGDADGYTVAEFLEQHVSEIRDGQLAPATTWAAIRADYFGPEDILQGKRRRAGCYTTSPKSCIARLAPLACISRGCCVDSAAMTRTAWSSSSALPQQVSPMRTDGCWRQPPSKSRFR